MFGLARLWESSKFPIKINVMGKSTTKDASQHCYNIDQLRSGGRGQPWLQVNSGANELPARPRPVSPGCSLLGGLRRLNLITPQARIRSQSLSCVGPSWPEQSGYRIPSLCGLSQGSLPV
ncbi:hypothetical protein RRG08_032206 [Elysia crispata]|uniref:Uncharacterized protein n=1 Tax=Elysia crispata TaxID=231223 RepID=A0AAE1DX44_9GAST|nr:hypothetical protein RRG08_032206 [Elysia crispata]